MNIKIKIALSGIWASLLGLLLMLFAQSDHEILEVIGMVMFLGGYAIIGGSILTFMIQHMRKKSARPYEFATVFIGYILGLLIWVLPPILTRGSEPPDEASYYFQVMIISGLFYGIVDRRFWVLSAIAITLGQFPAANWGMSMFFPFDLIILILGGLAALAGAAISSTIISITIKLFRKTSV